MINDFLKGFYPNNIVLGFFLNFEKYYFIKKSNKYKLTRKLTNQPIFRASSHG